jgi:hypothetical protein
MMDSHKDTLDPSPRKPEDQTTSSESENVFDFGNTEETLDITKNTETFDVTASQEATRARIALLFTQSFLLLVVFALATPFVLTLAAPESFPDPIESAKTLVTLLASVLAGPFGFIVGFYFKQNSQS